jgi:hypothetical protein
VTSRPFLLGIVAGFALPALVVAILFATGSLSGYLVDSRGYTMMPLLAPLGLLSFFLGWRLFDRLQVPRMGASFSLGVLVAGSLAGSLILYASSAERPFVNRIVFSTFGGPLLVGFWLWIGAVLGYAFRQQRALRTLSRET